VRARKKKMHKMKKIFCRATVLPAGLPRDFAAARLVKEQVATGVGKKKAIAQRSGTSNCFREAATAATPPPVVLNSPHSHLFLMFRGNFFA
jgi:hypothetical protein